MLPTRKGLLIFDILMLTLVRSRESKEMAEITRLVVIGGIKSILSRLFTGYRKMVLNSFVEAEF